MPKKLIIYTNGPDPLEFYLDVKSKTLPRHTYPETRLRNEKIFDDIRAMAAEISQKNGVIVYFKNISWRWYLPTIDQLQKILLLQVMFDSKDGTVLRLIKDSE